MPEQILRAFSSKMPESITRITMLGIEKRSRSTPSKLARIPPSTPSALERRREFLKFLSEVFQNGRGFLANFGSNRISQKSLMVAWPNGREQTPGDLGPRLKLPPIHPPYHLESILPP